MVVMAVVVEADVGIITIMVAVEDMVVAEAMEADADMVAGDVVVVRDEMRFAHFIAHSRMFHPLAKEYQGKIEQWQMD